MAASKFKLSKTLLKNCDTYLAHSPIKVPGNMFSRPFQVKTNTLMRNSDKRKLREDMEARYGSGFTDIADSFLSVKAEITDVSVLLHNGFETNIYCVDGNPMLFICQPERVLLPSVYALWEYPDLALNWSMRAEVVSKLLSGATLVMPDVVIEKDLPNGGLGEFRSMHPVSVSTAGNRSAVAVGVTAIRSAQVAQQIPKLLGVRGKGVLVHHVAKDHLWMYGNRRLRPDMAANDVAPLDNTVAQPAGT